MNILQGIKSDTTFCVSLNQSAGISPFKVLAKYTYAHPQFSLAAAAAQNRWAELDGEQHTHYCGAYWANGFHEDGVVSALRVAAAFGENL
jgi:predicted NAD/FAD-binding protein